MGLKLTIFILNQFISNNNGKFDKYHWDFRAEKVRMSRLQVLWLSGEKWTALQVSKCMGIRTGLKKKSRQIGDFCVVPQPLAKKLRNRMLLNRLLKYCELSIIFAKIVRCPIRLRESCSSFWVQKKEVLDRGAID